MLAYANRQGYGGGAGYGANPARQYDQYKQQSAMTASPGELTLMLYDGCIKFLKLFKMYCEEKEFMKANENSQKAQKIICELINSLDMRYEIAEQLLPLYDYFLFEITQSNLKKDIPRCDAVLSMIADMRETWAEVVKINRINQHK